MKKIFLLLLLFSFTVIYAQNGNEKTVTLVVSGDAATKEDATKIALRSAIEQAFGTFVSANTEILNDELIKDEIVTVSSGNIKSYKEISCRDNADGTKNVTVQAVVSIVSLVSYAQSKGVTCELSGATFMMNMKIRELNKRNELVALNNMCLKLREESKSINYFDYELNVGEPYVNTKGEGYCVDVNVKILPNMNFINMWNYVGETLSSLSLPKEEVAAYNSTKLKIREINYVEYPGIFEPINFTYVKNRERKIFLRNLESKENEDKLNDWDNQLNLIMFSNQTKFVVKDNLGNKWHALIVDPNSNESQSSYGDYYIAIIPNIGIYHTNSRRFLFEGPQGVQKIDASVIQIIDSCCDPFYLTTDHYYHNGEYDRRSGPYHYSPKICKFWYNYRDIIMSEKGTPKEGFFGYMKFVLNYSAEEAEKLQSIDLVTENVPTVLIPKHIKIDDK